MRVTQYFYFFYLTLEISLIYPAKVSNSPVYNHLPVVEIPTFDISLEISAEYFLTLRASAKPMVKCRKAKPKVKHRDSLN
jgi:hypothetical protein